MDAAGTAPGGAQVGGDPGAVEGPGVDGADSAVLLRSQTSVLEHIAAGACLSEVLTEVAVTLEELVPGCRCSILLLDAATGTLCHGAAPSLPPEYSTGIDGMHIGDDAGSCGTAAYLDVPVVAEDVDTDARWARFRALADRYALRSCWSTPIRGRAGVVGTFAVYRDRPHRPTAREENLVERLTHLASVAIDHDRLFGALTESEERFRRAFEDNAIGMALTDLDTRIVRTNDALCTLLGRTEDALLGTRLDELCPPARPAEPRRHPAQYEATVRRARGRSLDLVMSVSPVRDADGHPARLSVNVLDVTQRRAADRERRRRREADLARGAAEAASRAKSDFVSALGHELRTPLQAVTGFTELLRTLDLPPQRRTAALEHIDSASEHILSMVDDVLDVAKMEAGALPLHPADIDLDPVVDDVLTLLEPLAGAERIALDRSGPRARVHADARRLKQVLLNLVTNAIRYNRPDGTVRVGVRLADGTVVVTVADSGPGIAPEHLDRLFTAFDRLGVESEQGVGLGLPLARGLVEAMGGHLRVHSTVGSGTEMVVSLPAAR